MGFKGFFIGIDRYQSPEAQRLNCAVRDAQALHALFTDTLGSQCQSLILTDEEATRKRIQEEFEELFNCDEDDIVFISFSGHGSETHELVPHDYDSKDVKNTGVPLEELQGWFSKIPAKILILILDCCFSGALGAKALKSEMHPRMAKSTGKLLEELCGEGRIILTASSPDEPAWENQKVGHGLLTHFFLEALQGADEVRDAGKISILKLLEYVSKKVTDAADAFGHPQSPALRGTIDTHITWPIFKPGEAYEKIFPDRSKATATSDLNSLKNFGFPDEVIDRWASAIPSLNALQVAAINDYKILNGRHLVVSAPTSSGKTMIGELAALKSALNNKKALFLFPLKALVNDKLKQFSEIYSPFGIETIEATGENDDVSALLRGQYDIALLTYEKFLAIVLGNPHVLEQVGTVVIDEVQMIADNSRGANLEFILTLLRMKRQKGIEPQTVALSAVIGDTNGLEGWLDAGLLKREERPVPLDEGLISSAGHFRYIDGNTFEEKEQARCVSPIYSGKNSSQDIVIPLVRKIINDGGQVIVFRKWKVLTTACAKYLARDLGLPPASDTLSKLPATDPSTTSNNLKECLESGTAFHNADLSREERIAVEAAFISGEIKVIVATTTLAMGVNTPASSVIVVGLEHPDGPYSIAEYKNLVGRAGRLGFSDRGVSYLIPEEGRQEHHYWHHYVLGRPEDITSMFLEDGTDPRSLIIRVISLAQKSAPEGIFAEEIVKFLEGSFGAFLQKKRRGVFSYDHSQLEDSLTDLEKHNLVIRTKDNRIQLTELGMIAGESAISIKSFIRFVECLGRLSSGDISDPELIAIAQTSEELDQVNMPLHGRSTKEQQKWRKELARIGISSVLLSAMEYGAGEQKIVVARRKKAASSLAYISNMSLDEIERMLTQHMRPTGMAGAIRSVADRTCDVLPTVAQIAEYFNPSLALSERVERLITRLSTGSHSDMVFLATEVGSKLLRGDYLALTGEGYTSFDVLEKASDQQILSCVGNDPFKLISIRDAVNDHKVIKQDNQESKGLEPYVD